MRINLFRCICRLLVMVSFSSIGWWLCLALVHELQEAVQTLNSNATFNDDPELILLTRELVDESFKDGCDQDFLFTRTKSLVIDHGPWDREVKLANNVANFLTSMWRYKNRKNFNYSLVENEATMYSLIRSNVLSSPSIYGSAICFDRYRFKRLERFCPYAFKDQTVKDRIRVLDLAAKYDYMNKTEFVWWNAGRRKGLKTKLEREIEYYDTNFDLPKSNISQLFNVTASFVPSDSGDWTAPYYSCFGGRTWVFTYMVPFYDETDEFLGVVSINIELDSIDVDQCDSPNIESIKKSKLEWADGIHQPLSFYGSHRCKNKSSQCVHVAGGGFTTGSYKCVCRKGYYFPDSNAVNKSFKGSEIERTYEKNLTLYKTMYDCLPCPEGCEECVDGTPCMHTRKKSLKIVFLSLNEVIKALAIALGIFIFVFRERKIIKAASPVFMEIIVVGIILMYFEISLGYLEVSDGLCIVQSWLYHIGFILAFGSLLLKTWRIMVIFRLRSAKMIELTDKYLLKYLATMVAAVLIYLMIWTWTSTQACEIRMTNSGHKYRLCVRGWFSNAIAIGEILLLTWGVFLCLRVRNAPSAYNESKYIAWCIYNTMFVMILVGSLRAVLGNFHDPDVSYVVDFLSTHVVATVLLILLFVSKVFLLRKHDEELSRKTRGNTSGQTSTTDLRKSPFHLNRLVDGSFAPEIDEEKSVQSLESEIISLREEIRNLNTQLAFYESKQARQSRRNGNGNSDNGTSKSDVPQIISPGNENENSNKSSTPIESTGHRRSRSTIGTNWSSEGDSPRVRKGGSLIEDIKNSGKRNEERLLTMPRAVSVSDEALTTISRVSSDSQD